MPTQLAKAVQTNSTEENETVRKDAVMTTEELRGLRQSNQFPWHLEDVGSCLTRNPASRRKDTQAGPHLPELLGASPQTPEQGREQNLSPKRN